MARAEGLGRFVLPSKLERMLHRQGVVATVGCPDRAPNGALCVDWDAGGRFSDDQTPLPHQG